MTTQEKISFIREKVIACNPEIVELKFGCDLFLKDFSDFPNYKGTYAGKRYDSRFLFEVDLVLHSYGRLINIDKEYEIIGRQIRFSDVLLVISKGHGGNWSPDLMQKVYALLQGVEGWNLRKDDLSLQDEPTIDFIYSLLK